MRFVTNCSHLTMLAALLHSLTGSSPAAFTPFKTECLHGGQEPRAISVDVTGVQDLYLHVTYGGDDYDSDQAIWGDPALVGTDGTTVKLVTMRPDAAQVGWGELFVDRNQHGQPLNICGRTYASGFWAHAPSLLHFKLNGRYARFTAEVGIDKGAGSRGSAEFIITDRAPQMPERAAYMRRPRPKQPVVSRAPKLPRRFTEDAAKVLRDQGIDELVFVRRFTLTANHVYTEYVNSKWAPGGGLAVLDLKTGEVRDVVPEFSKGVVNRFDLSYDAKTVVFDYKSAAGKGYRIYEVGVDGRGLRQLTFPEKDEADLVKRYGSGGYHHGTDDLHPCYLPDGGIVFSSTRCRAGILCNGGDVYTTKVLYRMDADGENMRRLSHNTVSEASPVVMHDGRIIYHRWEYNDKGAGAVKCLWAMRPDGTASQEIYGNMITDPQSMIYARPIPGTSDKVVFLGTTHWGPNNAMGTVIVLDMNKDMRSREAMTFVTKDVDARTHDGFHFLVDGKWIHDKTGLPGRLFKDPYPISEHLFVVAHKPKGYAWDDPTAYGLYVLDGDGRETLLYHDGEMSCWHPYPLRYRPKPPSPQTPIQPELAEKKLAHCVVTDVYEGLDGVAHGVVKYIRILEQTPRPWAARNTWKGDRQGMAHSALGYGILGMKAQHGIVPVESDGSASFYVPADRNIYFQVLDENYMAIQTERTYVNYMPGETRSCIGCHERANQVASASEATLALQREPSTPGPQPGDAAGGKLFDYERWVQPVWNNHCVLCHNEHEKSPKAMDLIGKQTTLYCNSYENLMGKETDKTKRSAFNLVGVQVDENSVRAYVEHTPPYYFGAHSSLLGLMLVPIEPKSGHFAGEDGAKLVEKVTKMRQVHKAVTMFMTKEEIIRVVNWLDVSCQYYGSYWGMKNLQYKDSPYFRPELTFEEGIGAEWPKALKPLYDPPAK